MRRWIACGCLCLAVACFAVAVRAQEDEAARANELYQQRKRLDALPLYEDLTKRHPNEMLYWSGWRTAWARRPQSSAIRRR